MKWLNGYTIRFVLVGIVAAIVFRGGNAKADFTIGKPVNLGPPIWSPGHDPHGSCFSRDGLELYFASDRPGGLGGFDIWVATRETVGAPWGEPVNLGPNVNSPAREIAPAISPDGLEIYFTLYHDYNIRVCSRPSKDAPWSSPELLGPPVGVRLHQYPEVSADGLELYFESNRPGGLGSWDIWVSTRATTSDPWSEPINLGPNVNSGSGDGDPSISSDGLALFFGSNRPGGSGTWDLWVTTRPTKNDEWGPPVNYPSLNSSGEDFHPAISPDGSVLYFENPLAMWQSSITPVVDLNGDGIVDTGDMCIMVDHWGENYSRCDIGPMPWGDGLVGTEDLKVLAEHLFEEVSDSTLIAHWPLDETQGDIAYNSAVDCDGTLLGGPVWQPDGGMVAGALQFDGVDDYVITGAALNPADGKFSVITWIKGGAPGQTILSQVGTANWLCTDSVEGFLMTEIKRGRGSTALLTQTTITDGDWHRIGFVWDGSNRTLYVDGIAVAEDTQDGLEGSDNGLYFGCGKNMEAGTYWSGLIDNVRIYNRVVFP